MTKVAVVKADSYDKKIVVYMLIKKCTTLAILLCKKMHKRGRKRGDYIEPETGDHTAIFS